MASAIPPQQPTREKEEITVEEVLPDRISSGPLGRSERARQQWHDKLMEFVDANLSNAGQNYRKREQENHTDSMDTVDLLKAQTLAEPVGRKEGLKTSILRSRYTDAVTRERMRQPHGSTAKTTADFYKLSMQSIQKELDEMLVYNIDESDAGPFVHDTDEEVRRKDFEESIVMQSAGSSDQGHVYFKLIKLFRYLNLTNVQGSLIAMLSMTSLIRRSADVIRAIEESDGVVLMLNLLECRETPVRMAAMKVLSSLFQLIYLRRMSVAYGIIPILVDLLSETSDGLRVMSADLLASLAVLKEARQLIGQTIGIQRLVCLLNLTSARNKQAKQPGSQRQVFGPQLGFQDSHLQSESHRETALVQSKEDGVLVAAATALWRFSRHPVNQKLMQRSGILLTLSQLVKTKNERLLVPICGILQSCAIDPAFRLSMRTEGIVACLVGHLKINNCRVRLQCCRTLYHCVDNDQTNEAMNQLGGLEELAVILRTQADEVIRLFRSSWLDSGCDSILTSSMNNAVEESRLKNCQGENNNAVISVGSPTVTPTNTATVTISETNTFTASVAGAQGVESKRIGRLRMTGVKVVNAQSPSSLVRGTFSMEEDSITFNLLQTVLETITKTASLEQNMVKLCSLNVTEDLIRMLELIPPFLLVYRQSPSCVSTRLQKLNIVERVACSTINCLGRMCQLAEIKRSLVPHPVVVKHVVQLLSHASVDILVACIKAIASMTTDPILTNLLKQQNCFRYIFSLCFNTKIPVKKAALRSVCAFLRGADNRSAVLRPVTSSLATLVQSICRDYSHLISPSRPDDSGEIEELLAASCMLVAEIASEGPGGAILVELGILPSLTDIVLVAKLDCLKTGVSAVITQFARHPSVIAAFRRETHLQPLVEWTRAENPELRLNAIRCLDELTATDQTIGTALRVLKVLPQFLGLTADDSKDVQTAAAHVIGRIAKMYYRSSPGGQLH